MILTSYLRREILKPFFLIFFALTFIFTVYMLARYLAQAAEGEIPTGVIFKLVSLRVLIAQEILLPATFYFGVVIGLNRLFRNAEMIAMFACGFGTGHLLRAILPPALICTALVATLSLKVRPLAWQKFFALKASLARSFDLSRLKGGVFYQLPNGAVFFAPKISKKKKQAYEVFVYKREDGNVKVIRAKEGEENLKGERIYLRLKEGRQYEFQNEEGLILISEFETFTLPVGKRKRPPKEKLKAKPTRALWGLSTPEALAELEWRLSAPLGALVLAFLALALAPARPRESTVRPFLWALFFFVLYFYGGATLKKLVAQGSLPPWPGVFLILFVLIFATLLAFWFGWRRP